MIFYQADVLTKWEIILFLVSKCTILCSKDAKCEGECVFTELTCFAIVLSMLNLELSLFRGTEK